MTGASTILMWWRSYKNTSSGALRSLPRARLPHASKNNHRTKHEPEAASQQANLLFLSLPLPCYGATASPGTTRSPSHTLTLIFFK